MGQIKFFLTKRRNKYGWSQRRKKNGSLLVSHVLDVCFKRPDVAFIFAFSEQGLALKFWKALGFTELSRNDRAQFTVEIQEINPFHDTTLVKIDRQTYSVRTFKLHKLRK